MYVSVKPGKERLGTEMKQGATKQIGMMRAGRLDRAGARSRQQERTDATRRKLLAAAEQIFARSGFEAARLEDIAAKAGYTRGAFYANFDSKEDIFFTLLEEWVTDTIGSLAASLQMHEGREARSRALRQHYVEIAKDRRLVMLSLEYKLFAVRHPEAHARVRARQDRLKKSATKILAMVSTGRRPAGISNRAIGTALGALSQALLLERLVNPGVLTEKEVQVMLGLFFDALIPPSE
jgi:AcrR family transcriptional regulator